MPRVALYQDKYIEKDAINFINGKTRECGLHDCDVAKAIGMSKQTYSARKRNGRLKLDHLELFKVIELLQLTDEEIVKLMRGKVRA